jgi:hypothetical protein
MRSLVVAAATFVLSATPALATDTLRLPEPDTLLLIGVAAVGMLLALRKNKK